MKTQNKLDRRNKILMGLENSYRKMLEFKKQKNSVVVVLREEKNYPLEARATLYHFLNNKIAFQVRFVDILLVRILQFRPNLPTKGPSIINRIIYCGLIDKTKYFFILESHSLFEYRLPHEKKYECC